MSNFSDAKYMFRGGEDFAVVFGLFSIKKIQHFIQKSFAPLKITTTESHAGDVIGN